MEHNIASLNLPKTVVAQLKNIGYNNLSDIDPNIIKEKLGVDINICLQKAPETKTALEIYNEELLNGCLLSYNKNLDFVLRDVIIPKTISELSGESGSGKTQVWYKKNEKNHKIDMRTFTLQFLLVHISSITKMVWRYGRRSYIYRYK